MAKHGKRLIVDEHRTIGDLLYRSQMHIQDAYVLVSNRFPLQQTMVGDLASVMKLLTQIRSDLEDAMYEECSNDHDFPEERIERLNIYYPESES